ncbi:MFS transporter [Thalassotalea sp. PLHSN55]|uniref:MFS transporter n=1 Tax=Thalassotalea sp. PLHSN55 TaxID=3435888 RepID=UPI003F84CADA
MCSTDAYHKNIRKYQIYVTLSGFTAAGPLCFLFYLAQGISFSQLSIIETASLAVLVFFEVPSGAFADLIGRKKSMALGCMLMGIEFVFIGSGYSLSVFVLAALIGGIGISLESGADDALLYDSLKKLNREAEFEKILGQATAYFKVAAALAGILGGYLYTLDKAMVFYIFAGLYFLLGIYSLTMKETVVNNSNKNKDKHHRSLMKAFNQLMLRSYCCLKSNKSLALMIILMGLLTTTIRAHSTLLRGPIIEQLLNNTFYLGLILAAGLVLSSIISWYAHHIISYFNEQKLLVAFCLISSTAFIAIGLINSVWLIVYVLLMFGLMAVKNVFLSGYWHKRFKSRQRSTLISFKEACQNFIGIFTLFSTGFITDQWGIKAASVSLGVFILMSCLLVLACVYLSRLSNTKTQVRIA